MLKVDDGLYHSCKDVKLSQGFSAQLQISTPLPSLMLLNRDRTGFHQIPEIALVTDITEKHDFLASSMPWEIEKH